MPPVDYSNRGFDKPALSQLVVRAVLEQVEETELLTALSRQADLLIAGHLARASPPTCRRLRTAPVAQRHGIEDRRELGVDLAGTRIEELESRAAAVSRLVVDDPQGGD